MSLQEELEAEAKII